MKAKTKDGAELDLELYKFDTWPFVKKVVRVIDRLKVPVTMRDIQDDPKAAKKLVDVGGDDQVPCLFIDGKPLYESDDIIAFLEERFG